MIILANKKRQYANDNMNDDMYEYSIISKVTKV